jgi:hypothetical protein
MPHRNPQRYRELLFRLVPCFAVGGEFVAGSRKEKICRGHKRKQFPCAYRFCNGQDYHAMRNKVGRFWREKSILNETTVILECIHIYVKVQETGEKSFEHEYVKIYRMVPKNKCANLVRLSI